MEEAKKKIFMRDSRGLIVKGRSSGGISRHKEVFAHEHAEMHDLAEIVKDVKPTVLIGAAAQPNVFTEQIIKDMCSFTGWILRSMLYCHWCSPPQSIRSSLRFQTQPPKQSARLSRC